MPNVRVLQRSFSGGELSPEMLGRLDDTKFQSGLAKCRNFVAKPHGPVENRPGFAYVAEVKDSSKKVKLIPFTYSTTQTMILEVGEGYIRFHTQGSPVLTGTVAAWNSGTSYTIGDLCSKSGVNYYAKQDSTNKDPATQTAYWYALTSDILEIPNPFAETDLFDIHYVQSADVLTLVHPGWAPRELRRYSATKWVLSTVSFAATVSAPTGVSAVSSGASATKYTYYYVVVTVAADGVSESVASSAASVGGNLFETGAIITISWSAVSGASRYNVYKLQGGVYGYIGNTTGTSLIDDNIAPDLSKTPPNYETVFQSSGNFPGAVSYHEQRRCFAGTTNQPQNIWMTKSGTESDMSYTLPIRDDDRISVHVAAREANTIRHIVPLSQLLLLTSAAEWRVTSVNSDAITPTSISVKPQSYVGASNVQPCIVNNSLIYCAARGGHIRELGYNWQSNGFVTGDLSLRAAHLFDTYEITDMCYSKAPMPIVWFVSDTGKLLGLTYIPEQQVGAWHQHDTTNGLFESCASVAEGTRDVLYVVVQREIDGNTVRYIERMADRIFDDASDAFFVDSGLTFDGTNAGSTTMTITTGTTWALGEILTITSSANIFTYPGTSDVGDEIVLTDANGVSYKLRIIATSSAKIATALADKVVPAAFRSTPLTDWALARNIISGLDHLEGETVNILADGAEHPQCVVSGGAITLDVPSVVAQIGLPIFADIETLPATVQIDGFGQGRMKNVNKVWLRVYRSSGIFVGPDVDNLVESKQRTTEPYGSAPGLKSEEIPIVIMPSWQDGGQVYVRQAAPLPLTVVALTLEIALGG